MVSLNKSGLGEWLEPVADYYILLLSSSLASWKTTTDQIV